MLDIKKSAHAYYTTEGHAYADTAMEAALSAYRKVIPLDPVMQLSYLECEIWLLGNAIQEAVAFEKRLEAILDDLFQVLTLGNGYHLRAVYRAGVGKDVAALWQGDYECENCLGMVEHGCYCQKMGCPAPGVSPGMDDDL